jgi:chromosome segregation ATPase
MADTKIDSDTTTANSLKSRPIGPGIKKSGINTAIKEIEIELKESERKIAESLKQNDELRSLLAGAGANTKSIEADRASLKHSIEDLTNKLNFKQNSNYFT